ncbi:hypothetical protein FQR65_LT18457 [Abscondita terminalis]|nr:hypothetical protein FQR65_LT18457 [Abscondita terminalis]
MNRAKRIMRLLSNTVDQEKENHPPSTKTNLTDLEKVDSNECVKSSTNTTKRKVTVIENVLLKEGASSLRNQNKSIKSYKTSFHANDENEKQNTIKTKGISSQNNKSDTDSSDAITSCSGTEYILPSETTESDSTDSRSSEDKSSELSKEISTSRSCTTKD